MFLMHSFFTVQINCTELLKVAVVAAVVNVAIKLKPCSESKTSLFENVNQRLKSKFGIQFKGCVSLVLIRRTIDLVGSSVWKLSLKSRRLGRFWRDSRSTSQW